MIPLAELTDEDLLELIDRMESRSIGSVEDTTNWSRRQMVEYIESLKPLKHPPRPPRPPRVRKPRIKKNVGVGKFCIELLCRVVGHTRDGHPIGVSYNKMTKIVQKKFPDSAVDERHLRWYATKARIEGRDVPAHRERSKWI